MHDPTILTRSVLHRAFTPALLDSLYALSNRLMAESAAHFRVHADANDVVHVFERRDTGEPVGFQFWQTRPMDRSRERALIGGKLRIEPAYRRRGLHLRSGVQVYSDWQRRFPKVRFYRLSLASMFGFTSITSALAEYRLFDARATDAGTRAVRGAFDRLAAASQYSFDPATNLFSVGIRPTADTLAQYGEAYLSRPQAQVYARSNPGWRDNGCYVGFWFRFSPVNLWSLKRRIARSR